MSGELAALAAALGLALSSVVVKAATPRVRAIKINAVYIWITAGVALVVAALAGQMDAMFSIPARSAALLAGGAIIATTGDLALLRAITMREVGPAYTAATSLFVLFSVLGGWLLLGDEVSVSAWTGGAVIVAGVYLTNVNRAGDARLSLAVPKTFRDLTHSPAMFPAIAALLWTIAILMTDRGIDDADPIAANALANLAPAAVYAVWATVAASARPSGIEGLDKLRVGVSALLLAAAILSFMFALKLSTASTTAILLSSSPLFVVPLAALFLQERITRRVLAGVALCVGGVFAVVGTA